MGAPRPERHSDGKKRCPYRSFAGFSRRQIQSSYEWFDYHVHRGKKPLWKILPHVAARKLKSHPGLFYLYRRATRYGPLRSLKGAAKRA